MSESTRRSIHENIEKINGKSERRLSFFDKSHATLQEKEITNALLEEWNQQFSKDVTKDYVNVVKYPEDYIQRIAEERDRWLKGLDEVAKKADTLLEEENFDLVINEDILTTEQKAFLRHIESKINEFNKKANAFLEDFQMFSKMQQVKLDKIECEKKVVKNMIVAKNSKKES